jgi:hypothetical protein
MEARKILPTPAITVTNDVGKTTTKLAANAGRGIATGLAVTGFAIGAGKSRNGFAQA